MMTLRSLRRSVVTGVTLTSPLRRYGSNAHFVADIVDDAFGMSAVDYIKFKIEFKPD